MRFRSVLALLILAFALPSRATEYTDLWWNPAESGWGLTVTHQGDVVFLTIFVYGADGKAAWYAGPASFTSNDENGNPAYSGTLYQSTGPAFSAPFTAASVKATAVGTATFAVTGDSSGNVSYTVNGVGVAKSIVRQTFRINEDVPGNYLGGLVADSFSCPFAIVGNGNGFERQANVQITGPATDMQVAIDDGRGCTTQGDYTQAGLLGRVDGSLVCANNIANNNRGTATFFEMEANRFGITSRYALNYVSGCVERGRYTGARRPGSP